MKKFLLTISLLLLAAAVIWAASRTRRTSPEKCNKEWQQGFYSGNLHPLELSTKLLLQ